MRKSGAPAKAIAEADQAAREARQRMSMSLSVASWLMNYMNGEFIVNIIHAHPKDAKQLITSRDPVHVHINDTIRWLSDLGGHEGHITDDPSAFSGPQP